MRALTAALLLATAPAAAFALGERAAPEVGPAAADATAQAKAHFREGSAFYRQARYREAIVAFEAAHRLRPHGVIHFNLAQCHERLGELPAAIASYGEYLRALPQAEDRALVGAAIARLEARIGDAPLTPALSPAGGEGGGSPTSTPTPTPAPTSLMLGSVTPPAEVKTDVSRRRVWTWVAAGAAGAALAAGVAYGLAARSASDQLRASEHPAGTAQQLADTASARSRNANVLYGMAAVAGASGMTLFFVEGRF